SPRRHRRINVGNERLAGAGVDGGPRVPASPCLRVRSGRGHTHMKDYLALTKPNVTWLILMSTAVGFYLGAPHPLSSLVLLAHVVLGTALVASGTGALNQWMERVVDGKMRRTQSRPLPAGRLDPRWAFCFGLGLSIAGVAYLTFAVSPLTGFLGAFTC